jgi:hypothetical protein
MLFLALGRLRRSCVGGPPRRFLSFRHLFVQVTLCRARGRKKKLLNGFWALFCSRNKTDSLTRRSNLMEPILLSPLSCKCRASFVELLQLYVAKKLLGFGNGIEILWTKCVVIEILKQGVSNTLRNACHYFSDKYWSNVHDWAPQNRCTYFNTSSPHLTNHVIC